MKRILQKNLFTPQPQHPSYSHLGWHLRWRLGFLRAQLLYRPCWALKAFLGFGPRVQWGKRVAFLSRVRAVGPGLIILGDDSIFDAKPDLFTHMNTAVIQIGRQCFVNGTRIGAREKIQIGDGCILADSRIMDTDFHSLQRDRHSWQAPIKTAPVIVDSNVWIAAGSAVLKGVHIGQDSVVAFGAVVVSSIPAGKIFAGNPAKEVGSVP